MASAHRLWRNRQGKPTHGTAVLDRGTAPGSRLAHLWILNEGAGDAADATARATVSPISGSGRWDSALGLTGAFKSAALPTALTNPDQVTLLASIRPTAFALGTRSTFFSLADEADLANQTWSAEVGVTDGGGSNGFAIIQPGIFEILAYNVLSANETAVLAFVRRATGTQEIYKNGVLLTHIAPSLAFLNATGARILGARDVNALAQPFSGWIQWVMVFNGSLSATEIAQVSTDPWIVLRPIKRRQTFVSAAVIVSTARPFFTTLDARRV